MTQVLEKPISFLQSVPGNPSSRTDVWAELLNNSLWAVGAAINIKGSKSYRRPIDRYKNNT